VVLITPENRWSDDRAPWKLTRGHLNKLAPAGRLDIDSTGLLVLTQDGRIARHLIGEDALVEKEYLVRVVWMDEPETENVMAITPLECIERLQYGLWLDDKPLKPAKVSWQNEQQLRFVLREGKKRQIRRMCEQVGLKVVGLKRVRMGRVVLGKLPLGQWRFLLPHEQF
jgi:23S rRNA pseudouridine2604 synthase